MCSTACWTWDARTTSASPNLDGAGVSAPTPLIHATQPHAAVILTEGDIQDPMEPIFYGPMPADCLDQDLGIIAAAGQKIADLRFDLAGAVDTADGFHRQHGAQPGPSAQRFQTGGLRADEHTPTDRPAMACRRRH